MQLLGLASIMLLLPEMLLGWRLLSHKPVGEIWRGLLWILATFFAAAFVTTLPRIGSWLLPTGLGGVFGDALLRAPAVAIGHPLHGVALLVAALLFGVATAVTVSFAAGFGRARPSERTVMREADDDGNEDEGDRASAWLGMIAHALLSWKARAGRLFRRPQRTPLPATMQVASGPRQEPRFDAYGRVAAPAESNFADEEDDEEAQPALRRRAAPRAPRAAPPTVICCPRSICWPRTRHRTHDSVARDDRRQRGGARKRAAAISACAARSSMRIQVRW